MKPKPIRARVCDVCHKLKSQLAYAANSKTCTACASKRFDGRAHIASVAHPSRSPLDAPMAEWRSLDSQIEAVRPGALDFLQCPSRMGNRLYYRDGRVEHIGEVTA